MTNSLANKLGEAFQGMKDGPSRGALFLLIAAGVIVILVLIWRYFSTSAEESESARWLRWDSLSSPEQLKSFVEDKDAQGHLPGRLARLEEARRNLHDGLQNLGGIGAGRTQALDSIKKAAELYDKLADECADKPLLHQQALLGAAKAHEALGETDQARRFYQQLAQKYAKDPLGKEAEEQVRRLDEAEKDGDLKALREEYISRPTTP
jgi:tetratricopeptide (TPR) repeat protein